MLFARTCLAKKRAHQQPSTDGRSTKDVWQSSGVCATSLNKRISIFVFEVADTVQYKKHTNRLFSLSLLHANANLVHAYWLVLPLAFGLGIWSRMLFCCGGLYTIFRVFSVAHLYLFS